MSTPFEALLRSTLSEIAEEAIPVNLTSRAHAQAEKRRTVRVITIAVTAGVAVLIGTPLAFAAAEHAVTPAAPSPSPSAIVTPTVKPTPSDYPTAAPSPSSPGNLPSPSPSDPGNFPSPSPSPKHHKH
ncbi:hypothetical protein [Hamadaea tsunoensis]|uniref:hypothetical protein n=1 Tax=Hamadaea tsunoensis TaxID=53368 RepID=UPI0006880007|nr:hypothetical protein [Hamadaea tsunoensis]